MRIGLLDVFPHANKGVQFCCVCGSSIPHKKGYVHHYKVDYRALTGKHNKPIKPAPYSSRFTRQLYFCSDICVVLRGLDGVYEEGGNS